MKRNLLITYKHLEEEWAITECRVTIEFDKQYPMEWMRHLFELKHANTKISDKTICSMLMDYTYLFAKSPTPEYMYHICENCQNATVAYLYNIYTNMLDIISNSIYELMLCLKRIGITPDIVKFITNTAWNTRSEMVWIKLKTP